MILATCSCGLAKHPLKPVMTASVKKIEMASLEVNHILLIRRLNPLFAVMGSFGMLLDAVVVAKHAYKYEKRAGPVNQMGFWSPGLRRPFVPSVFVQAELIDPLSRDALLHVITLAARRIANGFHRKQPAFDPQLLQWMPEIPLSTSLRLKTA